MKLTDALAHWLHAHGIDHIFGLQGGAVVHIFDSIERLGIGVTYTHHEQAAALAAVAYSKVTENIGCAVVTTGPGTTNAITGLLAAWQDSVPCLFISGQVRSLHASYGRKVRQVGTQEVNICDIVRPITKYTVFVDDPNNFLPELDRALAIARAGRPGPVWLDLSLDLQWADVSMDGPIFNSISTPSPRIDIAKFESSLELLNSARKPLLLLGYGIRLAGCTEIIRELIESNGLPFVTTWTASDLFPSAHPLNLGIIGMSGQRGANKAVFASDTLLCLGSHLSVSHTTTLFAEYAPTTKKIFVNIDADQLDNLNINYDIKICTDLNDYLGWLFEQLDGDFRWKDSSQFKESNWYEPSPRKRPNSNVLVRRLTQYLVDPFCFIVDGGGTALYAGFQSACLKYGDRIICSSAISSMGTGLAEVAGVAMARRFPRLLCIIGDGSFLMNVQDLQVIRQNQINVIVLVINNNGYLAIRQTQTEFLDGRYYGTHPDWRVTMPPISAIAIAFDIRYELIDRTEDMDSVVEKLAMTQGPVICEVVVDDDQSVLFKQGYKKKDDGTTCPLSLNEMAPFMAG